MAFTQELQANLPAERCCDVVICAPYPLIAALETAGQGCRLGVGAQDVSEHQHGAFTGEVSAEQLSDLGAQYCIVGHSERRSYHGETDLQVNAKTKILLENSITPIICVGESLAQREHDLTETYVAYQVAAAFSVLFLLLMPTISRICPQYVVTYPFSSALFTVSSTNFFTPLYRWKYLFMNS